MNELEKLKEQKREIEAKIRALMNQTEQYGIAKVDVEHYPTAKPDRHYLAIHYKPLDNGRQKWQTIFSATDRQSVVDAIPGIAENLKQLYENLKGDSEGR